MARAFRHHLCLSPWSFIVILPEFEETHLKTTGMTGVQMLEFARRYGEDLSHIVQDPTLGALERCLMAAGYTDLNSDNPALSIKDMIRMESEQHLNLVIPCEIYRFYTLVSPQNNQDFILILRQQTDGLVALYDVAPRIKPFGSNWDWFGVYPDPAAFLRTRVRARLPLEASVFLDPRREPDEGESSSTSPGSDPDFEIST